MRVRNRLAFLFAATVALGGGVSVQGAAVIDLISFGFNNFSDDNRERLVNAGTSTDTTIDVGDSIRGVITFNQLFNDEVGSTLLGGNSTNDELTAIFQLRVASKDGTGTNIAFTFEPDPAFATEFNAAQGTMVVVFTDPDNDVNLDAATVAASEASATDGALFWELGFTGAGGTPGTGEGWIGTGGDDVSAGVINSGTSIGNANFAISRTSSDGVGGGLDLLEQDSVFFGTGAEVIGSSNIRGRGGLNTPWELASDSTFTINVIPLPPAAWSGILVLGAMGGAKVCRHLRRRLHVA